MDEQSRHRFGIEDILRDEALTQIVCYGFKPTDGETISELSGIGMHGSRFVLVYFEHELLTKLSFIHEYDSGKNLSQNMNIIKDAIHEHIGSRFPIGFLRRSEGLAVLVNIPDDSIGDDAVLEELNASVRRVIEIVLDSIGISMQADIGRVCGGGNAEHSAYLTARNLLRYREIMDIEDSVICYDEYCTPPYNEIGNARNVEARLFPSIRVCDFAETRGLLQKMVHELFYESPPSLLVAEYKLSHMKSLVINLISDMSLIVSRELFEDIEAPAKILETRSVRQLMAEVDHIFDSVEKFCSSIRLVDMPPLWLRDVSKFIDDNYTDPSLNISTIADHFSLNSDYLSRAFKRMRGVSILDYIHMLRIADARRYIVEGLPTAIVAQKVGYGHERTMTRAFKKYEGITPGMLVRSSADSQNLSFTPNSVVRPAPDGAHEPHLINR